MLVKNKLFTCVLTTVLSSSVFAYDLSITNSTDNPLAVNFNGGSCSSQFGAVLRPGQNETIDQSLIDLACKFPLKNSCKARMYANENCSGEPILKGVFKKGKGLVSVERIDASYAYTWTADSIVIARTTK